MSFNNSDSFEYRHKKFDQGKRPREDSISSGNSSILSEDEDRLQIDIESLDEEQDMQQTSYSFNTPSSNTTTSSYLNEHRLNPEGISEEPPYKRSRTGSFGSNSSYSTYSPIMGRNTSTPMMMQSSTAPVLAPTTAILPKISTETLASICKYHGNMVRKFPKKERTPKDQERRDKNTIACRMSRRVKKLEHIAIEEQYKEFSQQTFEIIERAMRSTAYLHELMKLSNAVTSGAEEEERDVKVFGIKQEQNSTMTSEKKPFTIAYLMGDRE
ncbi:protein Mabiki [Musca domestica]|uniref:Protein Mabiki n=1 Tax=Musca domestica TaxID=7370 RepID=A0A9J7CRI9_MUSDO|nr:protein Mabiki [Musca domestica]